MAFLGIDWQETKTAPAALLTLLVLLGSTVLVRFLFSAVRLIGSLFILPGKSLRSFGPASKSWAVITGASEGIGKEFALQLARAGYGTILISRSESKLEALANEITTKFNTPTKILSMDFSTYDFDTKSLESLIKPLDIAILINNVGQSHSIPVPFADTTAAELEQIILINNLNTLRLTRLITPKLIARGERRQKSLILTMGSFGGTMPTPLLATYSGSKAFLQQWSTALAAELKPHNVTVQLTQSYLVTTAMSKIRRSSLLIPTPRVWVRSTLARIGRTGGAQRYTATSTPFWSHAFMQWALDWFVPGGTQGPLVLGMNLSMHKGIRARALKKQANKKSS